MRAGIERAAEFVAIGKQAEEDVAVEPVVSVVCGSRIGGCVHRHAERLDELAVLHAGRAGRFAGAAIEAQVEMAANAVVQLQLAVGDAAHEVDAAARAVVLVAQSRRTSGTRTCTGRSGRSRGAARSRATLPDLLLSHLAFRRSQIHFATENTESTEAIFNTLL